MNDQEAADTYQWLNEALLHPDAGLGSLFFEWWLNTRADGWVRERQAWHWPLRIGFLPDDASRHLKQAIEDQPDWFYQRQVRFFLMTAGNEACDVLLSPLDTAGTLDGIQRARVRASAIVLLQQRIEGTEAAFVELMHLRKAARASAVAFVPADLDVAKYINEFLRQVAHDQTLDTVLHVAVGAERPHPLPIVVSTSEFLERSRISEVPKRLAARLAGRGKQAKAVELLNETELLEFDSEAHGASEMLDRMDPLEEELRLVEPRYIQAQTRLWKRHDHTLMKTDVFHRDAWHAIAVHVGPVTAGEQPTLAPFPDSRISWSNNPEDLAIVLTAPGCEVRTLPEGYLGYLDDPIDTSDRGRFLPDLDSGLRQENPEEEKGAKIDEAALTQITIWAFGRSTRGVFLLRPLDGERVVARIMILHANRVLQSAILEGAIVAEEEQDGSPPEEGTAGIALKPEGVLRMSLDELDERQTFDAVVVVNQMLDRSQVTTVVDNEVKLRSFDDGKRAAGRIRQTLEELVDKPEAFAGPDSEALRDLLVRLAMDGVPLYGSMVNDLGLGRALRDETLRLQLIMADPEKYLPLEFLYEGPAPTIEAPLCPDRTKALRLGTCGNCPNRKSSSVVCPVRFWGLSKVIERHAFNDKTAPEFDLVRVDVPLPKDRRFPAPAVGVFARSRRAELFDGGQAAVEEVMGSLATTAGAVFSTELWEEWKQYVAQNAPTLLVLLPHTDKTKYGEVLKIGQDACLTVAQIAPDVVGSADKIIVILLGCDTADPSIGYVSFPTRFRLAGAEIVVGTLTPVLGRHAAPVARTLIEDLHEIWAMNHEGATLGEAIAHVRRRFMERGLPVGLALIAYGDADWVLCRE
jgi:hypothetical protein